MNSMSLNWIAAAACFGLALSAGVTAQEPPRYTVEDLGVQGSGYGISSNGYVAGQTSNKTAFLWRRGQPITPLGPLGGPTSGASVVNAKGEVALSSDVSLIDEYKEDFCASGDGHLCVAAVWNHGVLTQLQPIAAGRNSQAYGINERGEIVGFAENERKDPPCASFGTPSQVFWFQPVVWLPSGEIRGKPLEPLPGDDVAFAWGINNRGQAVGGSGSCAIVSVPPHEPPFSEHGVVWQKDGTATPIPGLGGPFTLPTAINDRGDVVGGAASEDGTFPLFLWTDKTGTIPLGTFHGQMTVAPCCNTINNRRQIVGFVVDDNGNQRAFLREPVPDWRAGTWFYLDDLLPKGSPWHLLTAESINDAGQITGSGVINGETHAFLATPCGDAGGRQACDSPKR